MLSHFFRSTTLSPFERSPELTKVRYLYNLLKSKRDQFKREGDSLGAQSIAYRKFVVLEKLISNMDNAIAEFNRESSQSQIERTIKLVRALESIIHDVGFPYEMTLNAQRSAWYKNYNRTVAPAGYIAATGATLFLIPTFFGGLLAYFFYAPWAARLAKANLTIEFKNTKSMSCLLELYETLIKVGENLGLANAWHKQIQREETALQIPPPFYCAITSCIMRQPVVCTLDGMTYERDAITRWLTEHRDAPNDRTAMLPQQTVNDVLVRNEPLERLIADFRAAHPDLFDKEAYDMQSTLRGPSSNVTRNEATDPTEDDRLAMYNAALR